MLKICDDSLCVPLELIFHSCIETGKFPSEWKNVNVCPAHKRSDKQIVKNYRSISLLPVCGKIFVGNITESIWIQAWRLLH